MGFVETFGTLGRLWATYRRLTRFLIEERPRLLVLIDFPEFNLFLAKRAKRLGVPVLYYIGPQVWAWRRGRVRKIARRVDRLGLVFPFEPELYDVPAADGRRSPSSSATRCSTRGARDAVAGRDARPLRPRPQRPVLALLPGSRHKEIRLLLPPSWRRRRCWRRGVAADPGAGADTLTRDDLREAAGGTLPACRRRRRHLRHLHAADAALVASVRRRWRPRCSGGRWSSCTACRRSPTRWPAGWCACRTSACRTSSSAAACSRADPGRRDVRQAGRGGA